MTRLEKSPSVLFRDGRNHIGKQDTPSCVPLTSGDLLTLYLS